MSYKEHLNDKFEASKQTNKQTNKQTKRELKTSTFVFLFSPI